MLNRRWISLPYSIVLAALVIFPTARASAAPTLDVVAQIATHAVDLDWSESAPGTPVLYNIERALSPSGSWTALVDPADRDDTLRFTDAGIPIPNVTWYYRVAAEYDGVGPEIHSPVVAVTLDPDCEGYCVNHDGDRDGDGSLDADDNCVALPNDQTDTDGDGIGDACDSPADYTSFISVTAENEADLIAKIKATPDVATHLYVPPRNYYFTSTIDIERTAPLIIHGAGRNQTKFVVPSSGSLFRIRDATTNPSGTHIQFSNLRIQNSTAVEVMGISLETTLPGHLDINEVHFENVGLAILGPGFTRLQATNVSSRNYTTQSILVDHPDADFFMIGGGLASGGGAPLPGIDRNEVSSFRQKAGRVRAYTSSNGGARGIADYWFEAGSKFGAHMLGDIRSEGANASGYTCENSENTGDSGDSEFLTARLLYVEPTDERVDVVVKGTLASWSYHRLRCPHTAGMWDLVSYSSPGRLWLTNNVGGRGYETLVTGSAKAAQITSVNNQSLLSVHSTVDVGGTGQLISVGDVGSFNFACQESNKHEDLNESPCNQGPRARFYLPDGAGGYAANYDPTWDPSAPGAISPDRFENLTTAIVPFPKEDLPKPMARPVLTAPFADMASVTDFGAVVDDGLDDTAAIQAAFRESGSGTPSGARLYFPAGTYCVTSPLYWNHQQVTNGEPYLSSSATPGNVVPGNNQGWWAGAGSDLTKIIFDIGCDGTADTGNLFASQKMVEMVIQGITFETAAWNGVDDTKTFWVENYHQQCTNTGIPTNLPDCATEAAPPYQPARSNYELPDPFTMGASHGSVFDDTVFIGGKHAHAVAIETHTNNSEILWMNSHFTDAFRGVTVSNANALNNIVYNGTFERNDEMIGPGGGGDFSVFGATVDGGICPSILSGGSVYVYGLDDSGGAGCTSYIYAPGGSWNVMVGSLYENSTLAPSGPGAQVDRNRSGFFTLLHSEVISTMGVDLWNEYTTSESIVAIHSPHPEWDLDALFDETSFESDFPLTVPEPQFGSLLATGAAALIPLSRLRRSRRRT